jgi:hypothetical protein
VRGICVIIYDRESLEKQNQGKDDEEIMRREVLGIKR